MLLMVSDVAPISAAVPVAHALQMSGGCRGHLVGIGCRCSSLSVGRGCRGSHALRLVAVALRCQLVGVPSRRGIYRHGGHRSSGATSRVAAQDLELQQCSAFISKLGKVIISKLAISVGATKSANLPTIVKNKQLFFSFCGVRSRVLTFQSVRF